MANETRNYTVTKMTPVLIVDAVEPCLEFWVERVGFDLVTTVPHGQTVGFGMLVKDGIEVMYQSRASVAADVGIEVPAEMGPAVGLFCEVDAIAPILERFQEEELVVKVRETFYGTREFGVREPGGAMVMFAERM